MGPIEEYDVPIELLTMDMQPPILKPNKGHGKIIRIPSVGEEIVTLKCGRRKKVGHNRLTYTILMSLHEQNSTYVNNTF